MIAGQVRRILGFALTLSLVVGGAGIMPTNAQASSQRSGPAVGPVPSAPINPAGLHFTAYRSFGWQIVPGASFYLKVNSSVSVGPIHFAELVGATSIDLGAAPWTDAGTVNGVHHVEAIRAVSGKAAGLHTFQAILDPTDTLDGLTLDLAVDVQKVATVITIMAAKNPIQTHHLITLYPQLPGAGAGFARTGTIQWRDSDTSRVLATTALPDASWSLSSLPIGVRHFVAAYSGDAQHAAATSPVFTLTVVADIVDATGVGLGATSIYPVTDGYRDTLAITGLRAEPISVAIRIYGPTGSLVRSASIARATGAYSYSWNGRTAAGAVLAAGKYKVVQTLTDAYANTRAFTAYVSLSHKRLVTHTSYVTKLGSSLTAKGGNVAISTTAGYAKLAGGTNPADGGWEFIIPAAASYSSVTFQVYAKGLYGVPGSSILMQNFVACPRVAGDWYVGCFDRYKGIGSGAGSLTWYSTATTSADNRSGRYVRGMVDVPYGTVYVYKARVKVVYKLLE